MYDPRRQIGWALLAVVGLLVGGDGSSSACTGSVETCDDLACASEAPEVCCHPAPIVIVEPVADPVGCEGHARIAAPVRSPGGTGCSCRAHEGPSEARRTELRASSPRQAAVDMPILSIDWVVEPTPTLAGLAPEAPGPDGRHPVYLRTSRLRN